MKSAWRSCNLFKGIVHPKIKILSSFPHLHVIPKVHDFILAWNTLWTMCWSLFSNEKKSKYDKNDPQYHSKVLGRQDILINKKFTKAAFI